jgi:pyruvate dehydrogenase E1 component
MMPEVVKASRVLEAEGVVAGVVCLTSPDLVFRSFQGRSRTTVTSADIAEILFPKASPTPIVTVMDGHPHTLAFLAALRGDAIRCLGVTEFGQSSDLQDAHMLHQLDVDAIVDAGMTLAHR